MRGLQYSKDYIETVFYRWYENDRKMSGLMELIPETEDGRKPGTQTINDWEKQYGWQERADDLDAQTSLALDETVVEKRKKMFEKHAEIGSKLLEKAMEYLKDDFEFSRVEDVIKAISLGRDLERQSIGASDTISKIHQMTDEQLQKELKKLIPDKENSLEAEIVED